MFLQSNKTSMITFQFRSIWQIRSTRLTNVSSRTLSLECNVSRNHRHSPGPQCRDHHMFLILLSVFPLPTQCTGCLDMDAPVISERKIHGLIIVQPPSRDILWVGYIVCKSLKAFVTFPRVSSRFLESWLVYPLIFVPLSP